MKKNILSRSQIDEFVRDCKYKVEENEKFLSRCIDGRYKNESNLAPLAIPGADAGELALIFATANIYGFELDPEKVFISLIEVIGDIKNLNFHTDSHQDSKDPASGCGHMTQIRLDPKIYNLEKDQLVLIDSFLKKAKKLGAKEIVLEGEHLEGAVLQISGDYSVYPRNVFGTKLREVEMQVFVYQSSLVDKRHRALAKSLLKNDAVKLFNGCDEEYLYQVISGTTEEHLMLTVKSLAKGKPIYAVNFIGNEEFEIKEMDNVI